MVMYISDSRFHVRITVYRSKGVLKMSVLNKSVIINYLKQHKSDFSQKYSINKMGLFGSFATEQNSANSDVDIVYKTSSGGLTFS